ncbi:MAG: universal stress protein [Candidatus Eremiobacterota bacterium]
MSHILVPIDGSGFSHAALPHAVRMARVYAAELVLVGVCEPAHDGSLPEHLHRVRESIEQLGISSRVEAASGVPAEEIVRLAEETRADLIVISSHGHRGGGARPPLSGSVVWPLGSVTSRVMRLATCPVMVARPGQIAAGHAAPDTLARILLPLDGSPFAERALPPAAFLAGKDRARLNLLRVVDSIGQSDRWAEHLTQACGRYLEQQAAALQERGLEVVPRVEVGDPAEKILEVPTDLIVMATHGHSGLTRVILGSVAERVVQHARCPVLLIREHQGIVASPPGAQVATGGS